MGLHLPPHPLTPRVLGLTLLLLGVLPGIRALAQSDAAGSTSIYDSLTFGPTPTPTPTAGSLYKSLTFQPAAPAPAAPAPEAKPKVGLEAVMEQHRAGTYRSFDPSAPGALPKVPAPAAGGSGAGASRGPICGGVDALLKAAPGGFAAVKGEAKAGMLPSWTSKVTPTGTSGCSVLNGASGTFVTCKVASLPEGDARARWSALGAEIDGCLPGYADELRDGTDAGSQVRVFLSGFGGPGVEVHLGPSVVHDDQWAVTLRVMEHAY